MASAQASGPITAASEDLSGVMRAANSACYVAK
jgi:hypothetical protein